MAIKKVRSEKQELIYKIRKSGSFRKVFTVKDLNSLTCAKLKEILKHCKK